MPDLHQGEVLPAQGGLSATSASSVGDVLTVEITTNLCKQTAASLVFERPD